MRVWMMAIVIAMMGVGASRADAALSTAQMRALLDEANAKFNQGVEVSGKDRRAAAGLYTEAIARWRRIAEEGDVHSTRLNTNMGNAYLLEGDVGRAVASYKRAERLNPRDAEAKAGLAAARARVGTEVKESGESRAQRWLLSWRGIVPRGVWLWSFAGLYLGGWGVAMARGAGWRRAPGWLGPAMVAAAVVCIGPLVAEEMLWRGRPEVVVVADGTVGRNGPSEAVYEATFKEPLKAGVEAKVLERRGGWERLRLADGRETWVAEGSVERV
jgi:hypothetical protein